MKKKKIKNTETVKTILVVTGLPGSGKSEVSDYIKSLGIPMLRSGDVIREEVMRRGLELNTKNSEMISRKLREEEGMDAPVRRVGEQIKSVKADLMCVEGPRDMHEIGYLATLGSVVILIVDAPIKTRFERSVGRKGSRLEPKTRDPKDMEEFKWRDKKERERGMDQLTSTSKYPRHVIDNSGTKAKLKANVRKLVESLGKH